MTIQYYENRKLNEKSAELLVVHLEFGEVGIADASRLSIEDDIERLFREWIRPLIESVDRPADGLVEEISAFREARLQLFKSLPIDYLALFPEHIVLVPSFFLIDFEGNSPRFGKKLRACFLSFAIGAAGNVTATSISQRFDPPPTSQRFDPPKPQPGPCIVVPTQNAMHHFVSHLNMLQKEINTSPHARETYLTLLNTYAMVAEQQNAKLTVSVILEGNVTVSFQLTSEDARRDLPILVDITQGR